jgi:hypothetical protein
MPSAGEVSSGVVKRRNSMITDTASRVPCASTVNPPTNHQLKASAYRLRNRPAYTPDPGRSGNGAYLRNQDDGNIVIYGPGWTWASRTNGKGKATLVVQDDGNVVAYGSSGPTWTTLWVPKISSKPVTWPFAPQSDQLPESFERVQDLQFET